MKQIAWIALILLVGAQLGHAQQFTESEWIRSIAWSPDGRYIAVANQSGGIWVQNSATEETILTVQSAPALPVYTLAWSPDGGKLASGGEDPDINIWDAATGKLIQNLQRQAGAVRTLSWSPDSTHLVSASQEGFPDTVQIWDVASGRVRFSPTVGEALVAAWSPDGETVAIGGFGRLQVWHVARQELAQAFNTPGYVVSIAWNVDGTKIAISDTYVPENSTVQIWDVPTEVLLFTLEGHSDVINTVRWSADGLRLVTASHDKTVRMWNALSGQIIGVYPGNERVFTAELSPYGGRLAYGLSVTRPDSSEARSLEIIVPAPSFEQLNAIAAACVRDRRSDAPEALALDDVPVTAATLAEFVARLDALPDDAVPFACAADLRAVAGALRAQ